MIKNENELIDRNELFSRKIIAVDFDGTLWDIYSRTMNDELVDLVRDLDKRDDTWIMIWTCRTDDMGTARILERHDVPYDSINEYPHELKNRRKPVYDILIDDRAISFTGDNVDDIRERVYSDILKEEQ